MNPNLPRRRTGEFYIIDNDELCWLCRKPNSELWCRNCGKPICITCSEKRQKKYKEMRILPPDDCDETCDSWIQHNRIKWFLS